MKSCYLTIDDSPSPYTDDMVDFLCDRNVAAMIFVRGHLMNDNSDPIIRAIKKGFVIANHSYSHRPFGELSYEEAIIDIEKCDALIDVAYKQAGVKRPGKYFRFPYLDRGNGDRIERHFETVSDIDINVDEGVAKIQGYLKSQGYVQPFQTNHPIYNNASIAGATDCLMTFTSFDWMLTKRHVGQWDYKTIDDLKKRIDTDENLSNSKGNILIFHDDREEILPVFKSLIDHMLDSGYEFLSYDN